MMTNKGITPPDFDSPVGRVRLNIGDVVSVPLDPPEVGFGDYRMVSDEEIETYLTTAGDSPTRATGMIYLTIAGLVAKDASLVKTYDLSVDNRSAPEQLRLLAKEWFTRADEEDAELALEDSFIISPTGRRHGCRRPEAAPYQYCGRC